MCIRDSAHPAQAPAGRRDSRRTARRVVYNSPDPAGRIRRRGRVRLVGRGADGARLRRRDGAGPVAGRGGARRPGAHSTGFFQQAAPRRADVHDLRARRAHYGCRAVGRLSLIHI